MGWMFTHRAKGATNRKFFEPVFAPYPIVDIAQVGFTVFVAVQYQQSVEAYIVLTRWHHADPDYNYGYKEMHESMGAYDYNCPKRILDLLTPIGYEYANKWRQNCYDRANRPKIKAGDIVITKPMYFGEPYGEIARFKVVSVKSPMRFTDPERGYNSPVFSIKTSTFNDSFISKEV